MNILFFLKPKSETAYIYDSSTLRQALESMEYHKYASIPLLNRQGEYVGTITEGDIPDSDEDLNVKEINDSLENILSHYLGRHITLIPCAGGDKIAAERETI